MEDSEDFLCWAHANANDDLEFALAGFGNIVLLCRGRCALDEAFILEYLVCSRCCPLRPMVIWMRLPRLILQLYEKGQASDLSPFLKSKPLYVCVALRQCAAMNSVYLWLCSMEINPVGRSAADLYDIVSVSIIMIR